MVHSNQPPQTLEELVQMRAAEIRRLEVQASERLHREKDASGYRELLEAKCRLLLHLPEEARVFGKGLTAVENEKILGRLEDMARRAQRALEMGSVFFMANLLYPDNYHEGDKTELEKLFDAG